MPHTDTDSLALFLLEQWQASERLALSLGARLEHTRVDPDAKGNETFAGADSTASFNAASLSVSVCGTNASSPRAENSLRLTWAPITPSNGPSGW